MSARGDLVPRPHVRGELLPPAVPPPRGKRGRVFRDFTRRLRGYVAPPPPSELAWQAVAGAGMILGSAGLIALLPGGHGIRHSGVLRWVGRGSLASTLDVIGKLDAPLALFGLIVLVGVAAVYLSRWGAMPALVFLTTQTWLGVAALGLAVFGWGYLFVVAAVNLAIWAAYITFLVACGLVALAVLGLFADS